MSRVRICTNALLPAEPVEQVERQAFKKVLPDVCRLRGEGYSFDEICDLLLIRHGFALTPAVAREYYMEMIAEDERELAESGLVQMKADGGRAG